MKGKFIQSSQIVNKMKKLTYDSTFTYPLVIKNGYGSFLEDIDGKKYLDFTSNIASCPLGYSHPEILKILKKYSNIGAHKISGQDFYCKEHLEIARKVISISNKKFKAFFINSGAEAVENAIKLAYRKYGPLPGISCINSFHGRTLGALSLTYSKDIQKTNFPEFPVKRIKFCTTNEDSEIDKIEILCKENKIAFVITEIIQGEGGVNIAGKRFLSKMYSTTRKYKIPLIIDEVQSGIGRTGKWWAYEHYDIRPDIITIGKALQVGAVLFDKYLEPDRKGVLSSTWGGGSRIDLAIGAKTIEIIKKEKIIENVEKMSKILRKGLNELCEEFDSIFEVRGLGLMIGIEFNDVKKRDSIIDKWFNEGLLVLPAGFKSIRILPPLIISNEEINHGLELMRKGLK